MARRVHGQDEASFGLENEMAPLARPPKRPLPVVLRSPEPRHAAEIVAPHLQPIPSPCLIKRNIIEEKARRLYFDSAAAAPMGELWLMDANGFDTQRLASADAGRGFSPAWSPDGGKIAFVGRGQTDNPESVNLSIYDLKNKQLVTIPVGPFTQPVWSPDSALIVFGSQASISPGNSTTQTVTPGGDTPEPAGGDRINLWVYDLAGGKANILVNNACCAGWIH